MRFFLPLALVLLWLLAACGAPETGDPHGVSTDLAAATGFFTANSTPPPTARDIRGDGVLRDADERPYGYVFLGQALPEISGPLVSGGTWSTSDIDEWTVMDVWGIWCGDCMADAPYAAELARRIAADPALDFISLHTPPSARRVDEAFGRYGSVEAYFADAGYSYRTVLDADASLREALQIAWTPTYLLISPDGIVRGFRTDLSVAGGADPVADFLADITAVQAETALAVPAAQLRLDLDGVAGLGPATPFTQEAIAAAFPGLTVRAEALPGESGDRPVFHVSADEGAARLFTLLPSWDRGTVIGVTTTSADVAGPMGTRIGQTRPGDLPAEIAETCSTRDSEGTDQWACGAIVEGRMPFVWIFDMPDAEPSRAVLSEMQFWMSAPVQRVE